MEPTTTPEPLATSYTLDAIVLDTETTGFEVSHGHRLIEIASVDVIAGVPDLDWSTLVHPGRPIPEDATRVHGITDAMVAESPTPEAFARGLRFRLEGAVLCFHNAPFDLPFVQELFRLAGAEPLTNAVVDTLGLARGIHGAGRGARNGVSALTARLQLPQETAHRALGDARMTARLLCYFAGWYEQHKGIASFAELCALSQDIVRRTSWKR